MRTKKLLVLALVVFAIAGATAVTLGDYVEIERDPPEARECLCPAIWDPVICKGSDGSIRAFSNACVAGCSGYTKCARYAVAE